MSSRNVNPSGSACARGPVAYVISLFTDDSTFILREIEELLSIGWSVHVFSLKPPQTAVEELRRRTHYQPFLWSTGVARSVIYYLLVKPSVVARLVAIAMRFFWRRPDLLLKNVSVIPKCMHYARTIQSLRCTHIHAHWATVSTFGAFVISTLTELPFSFTGHAWDIFVDTTMLAFKMNAASAVITCTEYNRRHLIEVGGPSTAHKIRRIYHGLRLEHYVPRSHAKEADRFEIISVGRWVRQKGFHVLVDALKMATDNGLQFHAVIVAPPGDYDYEMQVREQLAGYGLQRDVEIYGHIPHSQLVDLISRASVMVMASIQDTNGAQDGIPNVLIEALAVGTPVVSTNLSGIPELVRHDDTGLLVPPNDAHALAAALVSAAYNHDAMDALARTGRAMVHKLFDARVNVYQLAELFRDSADSGSTRQCSGGVSENKTCVG